MPGPGLVSRCGTQKTQKSFSSVELSTSGCGGSGTPGGQGRLRAARGGMSVSRELVLWARRVRLSRKLALLLAIAAALSAVATFAAMRGVPPFDTRPHLDQLILLVNIVLVLPLVAIVAWRIVQVWAERRRGLAPPHPAGRAVQPGGGDPDHHRRDLLLPAVQLRRAGLVQRARAHRAAGIARRGGGLPPRASADHSRRRRQHGERSQPRRRAVEYFAGPPRPDGAGAGGAALLERGGGVRWPGTHPGAHRPDLLARIAADPAMGDPAGARRRGRHPDQRQRGSGARADPSKPLRRRFSLYRARRRSRGAGAYGADAERRRAIRAARGAALGIPGRLHHGVLRRRHPAADRRGLG